MKPRKITLTVITVVLVALVCGYYGWYKPGADRAKCILNVRTAHSMLRGYQGVHGMKQGDPVDYEEAFRVMGHNMGKCPTGGTYTFVEIYYAPVGTAYLKCSHEDHKPVSTPGW